MKKALLQKGAEVLPAVTMGGLGRSRTLLLVGLSLFVRAAYLVITGTLVSIHPNRRIRVISRR